MEVKTAYLFVAFHAERLDFLHWSLLVCLRDFRVRMLGGLVDDLANLRKEILRGIGVLCHVWWYLWRIGIKSGYVMGEDNAVLTSWDIYPPQFWSGRVNLAKREGARRYSCRPTSALSICRSQGRRQSLLCHVLQSQRVGLWSRFGPRVRDRLVLDVRHPELVHCVLARVGEMFSSTSYPSNNHQSHAQEHRPGFPHSHSQPFTVAGMTSQNTIHSPNLRSSTLAGSSVGGTLSDSLNQSRSHYQPGYLLVRPLLSIVPLS